MGGSHPPRCQRPGKTAKDVTIGAVQIPGGLLDPVRTLTANIAAEMGEVSQGSEHYQVLFAIGVLLFAITFLVNLTADLVVRGVRRK